MKVCIAGSRDITEMTYVLIGLERSGIKQSQITEIVSGGARGVDLLGEKLAEHLNIPVKKFIADWGRYGKSAGPRRNKEMAKYADAFVVVHNGSRGSANMIKEAESLWKPVTTVKIGG